MENGCARECGGMITRQCSLQSSLVVQSQSTTSLLFFVCIFWLLLLTFDPCQNMSFPPVRGQLQ